MRTESRPGVGRLPHLSHAAFADEGGDVVMAEPGTSFERHGLLGRRIGPFYAEAVARSSRRTEWGSQADVRSVPGEGVHIKTQPPAGSRNSPSARKVGAAACPLHLFKVALHVEPEKF